MSVASKTGAVSGPLLMQLIADSPLLRFVGRRTPSREALPLLSPVSAMGPFDAVAVADRIVCDRGNGDGS